MIKELLHGKVSAVLTKLNLEKVELNLDHPTNLIFGDYTTNVALQLAKKTGRDPRELANEIAGHLHKDDLIEKAEVAGPGFINIWLTKDSLLKELQSDGHNNIKKKGEKILLEFGQPNTHKLPHIGHLFSYIYGATLARILEHEGNTLYRANYQGDIGLHVAKCLSQIKKSDWDKVKQESLEKQVKFLQKCYQNGSKVFEENPEEKKRIHDINKKIFENDPSIVPLWQETRAVSVKYLMAMEKNLGIKYDRWFYETETGPLGKKLVEENIGKVFEESDGAVVFRGEKYGLHTRVFINSIGLPTYEAKDIGLYALKKKEFDFDRSIVTIANEQSEYQRVVMKAAELVFPELTGKLSHIGFGMINLTTGKMSSRTGVIVDAVSLIDEVKSQIKKAFELTDNHLIDTVAYAAIKYSFLKSDAFSDIAFDLEKSISREGDSGPYILYTYVRCQSVLAKLGTETQTEISLRNLTPEEDTLMRLLYRLPEIITKASVSYSPHLIASYLFDLAQKFNLFYQKHSILKADYSSKALRILITRKTASVIQQGLDLLGIKTVEKM